MLVRGTTDRRSAASHSASVPRVKRQGLLPDSTTDRLRTAVDRQLQRLVVPRCATPWAAAERFLDGVGWCATELLLGTEPRRQTMTPPRGQTPRAWIQTMPPSPREKGPRRGFPSANRAALPNLRGSMNAVHRARMPCGSLRERLRPRATPGAMRSEDGEGRHTETAPPPQTDLCKPSARLQPHAGVTIEARTPPTMRGGPSTIGCIK